MLCSCPRTQTLANRVNVIVDRLGKPENLQSIVILAEKSGKISSSCIRVVSSNRV
jgi:hypothetical protein